VALARALVAGPSLLLLDEPLSSVDRTARRDILEQLEQVIHTLDIPVLHVTHDPAEAARLADHLVVLDHGEAVAQGSLADVLTMPAPGLGAGPDAAAVVTATVTRRDRDDELATLDFAGGRLLAPDPGLPVGDTVRVRILARDVSLAASRADDSSILNLLPVRVVDLAPDGPSRMMVRIDAGGAVLLAAVTRRSADTLELARGRELYAQVKSLALL
jgi:molybdate transport system ATP-binding protein